MYDLRSLENYSCFDEKGKDQGINGKQTTICRGIKDRYLC